MEMRFWVGDKVAQDAYEIKWHPGQENLADYQSKHHLCRHGTYMNKFSLGITKGNETKHSEMLSTVRSWYNTS